MCNNQFLSPHFKLSEFTKSRTAEKHGIVNIPPAEAVENLRRLCEGTLEPLREKLGLPIIVTSGYRTKALNEILVHAARRSQHMAGCAADFWVSGHTDSTDNTDMGASHRDLLIRAFRLIITDDSIDYDQLIIYPGFIHVSYVSRERNRHKLTKAFGNGKYCALTREQALAIS